MCSLRSLALNLLLLSAVLPIAQAKTNYAYVANFGAGTVSVINTTTNAVVTTIAVGSANDVAVNQAGTFAYVANSGASTVSVISTTTNTVVANISVPSGANYIALAPNGKTAYVANAGSPGTVSVVNLTTKTVTTTVTVQNVPHGMGVTPNGTLVYVTNYQSATVSVISTLTNAVVATTAVGTHPESVAISPDSSTAYVTAANGLISVIRTADNTVVNTINLQFTYGSAVSPDGHWLYVAVNGSGTSVAVIDTSTLAVNMMIGTAVVVGDVAFSQDSAFAYVTEGGNPGSLLVINTQTKAVVNTITVGNAPSGVGVMGSMKVSTVAGGFVGDGGQATNAAIGVPTSTVRDAKGNLYISDDYENRIRKVSSTGVISTYAGTGNCGYNGDNIASSKAMLCLPSGLVLDATGNLIVADGGNFRIRKISTTGKITTIAGNGVYGYSGDGGSATKASIGQPVRLAYDAGGNLYFADVGNCVVRKIDTGGTITTYAGTGTCGYNGDGIPATTAQLNLPRGVALDTAGNLYIGDSINHRVRIVTPGGTINTIAGNGKAGFSGDGGPATSAAIGSPRAVLVQSGILYISQAGQQRFRQVNLSTNIITTFAGSSFGYDGDNHSLLTTMFDGPVEMLFDPSGNPIFDDAYNGRVRKATAGIVNTIAGGFIGDGSAATAAALLFPEALAIDKAGNFYIADYAGNRVRKVSAGKISTVAGTGVTGYSGDGGSATSATLNAPQGVEVDSTGNVFIADTFNGVIRKVTTAGTISTFATNPNFNYLAEMGIDSANNLYVADNGACVVWKITPAAVVSIFAGVLNVCGYNGDGITATTAQLSVPNAVAVDSHGNVLIADYFNNRVREVNTSGIISTIAGNGTCAYTGDGGSATAAELCPNGVAVDKSGTIYVADLNFERIRKIKGGIITTFAGAGFGFNGDGLWPLLTTLDDPVAVAVDSKGAVYELDDVDHRLRKIQ